MTFWSPSSDLAVVASRSLPEGLTQANAVRQVTCAVMPAGYVDTVDRHVRAVKQTRWQEAHRGSGGGAVAGAVVLVADHDGEVRAPADPAGAVEHGEGVMHRVFRGTAVRAREYFFVHFLWLEPRDDTVVAEP